MNGSFYEQLGGVAGLFEQWGACERTVVACALARRVPPAGLRLLRRAVDAALRPHAADESLEQDANDAPLLAALLAHADFDADGEKRLQKLLTLLPLLRTENIPAKDAWVAGAGALAQRCVDALSGDAGCGDGPRRAADLCRQLLAYLLVHPALNANDHRTLSQWLRYVEEHMSGREVSTDNIWGAAPFRRTVGKNVLRLHSPDYDFADHSPLHDSFSKNGRDVDLSLEDRLGFEAGLKPRSNSLTPCAVPLSSSAENLSQEPLIQKPRSFSLSSENSLRQLRPYIMYGTGSETRLDDLRSHNYTEQPGMSTVAQWLKSLRLHKYVWLFTNISYDQMMAMDEAYLEKLGVTKGARHKILVSIKKLSERAGQLAALERELGGAVPVAVLRRAMERVRAVLLSPMPPHGDLPPAIVRVLQLAAKSLELSPAATDDEPSPLAMHCWLVEKALHHEALGRGALRGALVALRHRVPPSQFYHHVDAPHRRTHRWRQSSQSYWARRSSGACAVGPAVPRGKSHSYPPERAPPPPPPLDYANLDALCLQMTNHAID